MKKEKIDFSGVPEDIKSGGGSVHVPPDDYKVKITKCEKKYKDDDRSNVPYFLWSLQITEGEFKGKTLRSTTSLKPEALFNLRNLIFAVKGKNVAGKTVNFDPDTLVGEKLAVTVEDNEYTRNGKTKIGSQVVDFIPLKDLKDDDDDEDDDEAEESDDDDDDLEDVDVDEDL